MTASVSSTSTSSLNMQMEDVADKMFVHMNRESPEMNIFGLVTRQLDGKYYRVDFQTAGNPYMASRAEDEFQPGYDPSGTAEDQMADFTVGEMLFRHRSTYMSTDFTGQMKAVVKSKKGGYMNLADFRFKDATESMKERVGTKLAGSSLGCIGRIQTVSSTTVTLRYAGYSAASTLTWENGSRYIRKGLVLDATTATRSGALRASTNDRGRRVTSEPFDTGTSSAGPTFTLNTAPTTWAADDYLVIYNERPAGAITGTGFDTLKNPLGILDAIDDGGVIARYGEVTRSSNSTLQALVFGNDSSAGTLRKLNQQIINYAIERKNQIPGGGGKIDVAYSTFGVMRQFVDALTIMGSGSAGATASNNPMRFNNPGASPQKIGFNSFEIFPLGMTGSLKCMPSRLAPHHSLFLLQRDTAILLQDGPPRYINEDGMTIRKTVGKDVFTADWVWRATGFVCREPWKNVRIDDLSGDHMSI